MQRHQLGIRPSITLSEIVRHTPPKSTVDEQRSEQDTVGNRWDPHVALCYGAHVVFQHIDNCNYQRCYGRPHAAIRFLSIHITTLKTTNHASECHITALSSARLTLWGLMPTRNGDPYPLLYNNNNNNGFV